MKIFFTLALCFSILFDSPGQKTFIRGNIPSMNGTLVTIQRPTRQMIDIPKGYVTKTFANQAGSFSLNLDFINQEIITLTVEDTTRKRKLFEQYFFISKGDNLLISEEAGKTIKITGIGAKNNQLKDVSLFYHYGQTKQDSVPDRLYNVINRFYEKDKKIIDSLIASQNPSQSFTDAWHYHLKYARVASLYYTYDDLNTTGPEAFKRNKQAWQNRFTALAGEAPVSDEKALVAPSYHRYLDLFLETKFTDAKNDYFRHPQKFYDEWYDGDSLVGKAIMQNDFRNQLKQKIIERYFTGRVKEQMYSFLFDSMIKLKDFSSAESIYKSFIGQYPDSRFIQHFKKPIGEAISNAERTLDKRIVFLDNIETLDSILKYFKGKTVFLDMWGSWCRPCREDINLYSADIKKRYKHKDVVFLYITNFDSELKWKQLVAFYKLHGYHIFASEELTKEIMRKIQRNSYPSYAIIDKYGNIEKMRAEGLKDRPTLDAQIEEALNK